MLKKLSLYFSPITQWTAQSKFQSYPLKSILQSYYTKNTKVYTSLLSHQKHYNLHFSPITPKALQSTLQSYHTKSITVYTSVLSLQTFTNVLSDFSSDISVSIPSFHKILSPATSWDKKKIVDSPFLCTTAMGSILCRQRREFKNRFQRLICVDFTNF